MARKPGKKNVVLTLKFVLYEGKDYHADTPQNLKLRCKPVRKQYMKSFNYFGVIDVNEIESFLNSSKVFDILKDEIDLLGIHEPIVRLLYIQGIFS